MIFELLVRRRQDRGAGDSAGRSTSADSLLLSASDKIDVIQALAKTENYDLVVSEGVVFASERVDITDKVISRLQATFKSGG